MDIHYNLKRVPGISCPNKFLLTINGRIVCFVNSKNGAGPIMKYAYNAKSEELKNGKVKKIVDSILGRG